MPLSEKSIQIGDTLYGYCGGFFGRDSYDEKRVEGVGRDWIVCRDSRGGLRVATADRDMFAQDLHSALSPYLVPEWEQV